MNANEFDLTQLTIRMGQVKLLDLDGGYPILTKLNAASGDDSVFKIEMDGVAIKAAYDALPAMMRKELDKVCFFESQNELTDTLRDIDRTVKHMAEIADRDTQTVEAYISISMVLILILALMVHFTYNAATADVRMNYPRYFSNAISMLISNLYQKQNDPVPADPAAE